VGSEIVERTLILRSHRGQESTLTPEVRFMSTAHSMYRARANSSPSASRPQWWTVTVVGSTDRGLPPRSRTSVARAPSAPTSTSSGAGAVTTRSKRQASERASFPVKQWTRKQSGANPSIVNW
jgi:hypothetical protein